VYRLNFIRQRLADYEPKRYAPGPHTRQAAVAVILRAQSAGEEILFIKRAEKKGDPWSGHMAFPGGHLDSVDEDLRAAAMRETLEEIGLNLNSAAYLGAIDEHRANPRGRTLDMIIGPHVFELSGDPPFTTNYEVDEVVWAPLAPIARGEFHDTETKPMAGQPTVFNGYRLAQGHFVWGLTYRMLNSFFSALDPEWTPPPEL
jgi:ADP-ribose pyrophosphatase YjhB (NUDIX family)